MNVEKMEKMYNFLFKKRIFWAVASFVFIYFVGSVREVLSPFIMALILAHIGNPLIEKLAQHKIPRWLGSIILTSSISLIIIIFVINVLPIIIVEIEELLGLIPTYSNNFVLLTLPKVNKYLNSFGEKFVQDLYGSTEAVFQYIFIYLFQIIKSFFASGLVVFNILSIVFLTPIITFYCLKDWPKLINKIAILLPASSSCIIRIQLVEINKIIHQYLKGQLVVIIIMSAVFALILNLFKVKFIVFLAIMSGLLTIIPYLGFAFSLCAILLIAYSQFQDIELLLLLGTTLIIVHIFESNYLTPKLVGESIGLHPVIIIFVVMVGGVYFGLVGAILSIPCAAILAVFTRMLVQQYLLSDYSK